MHQRKKPLFSGSHLCTCGDKEIRTPDLCSAIATLYQLSYIPTLGSQKYKVNLMFASVPSPAPLMSPKHLELKSQFLTFAHNLSQAFLAIL